MGTEIFHFWPWGAEKIGFKESNPISKNMAKLNFPPIQFSLSVLRNETPCTFEYPSTIRKSLMMRNKRSGSGRRQHLFYCFLCPNNSCALTTAGYLVMFLDMGLLFLTQFSQPPIVKNEKFQCPSESWGPEDFKTHPTFVLSAIFGGVMASQTWEHFFWDTLYI